MGRMEIPYIMENKQCLKSPTRHVNLVVMVYNHHIKIPVLTIVAMFIITIWYIYISMTHEPSLTNMNHPITPWFHPDYPIAPIPRRTSRRPTCGTPRRRDGCRPRSATPAPRCRARCPWSASPWICRRWRR